MASLPNIEVVMFMPIFALSITLTDMFYLSFTGCTGLPLPLTLLIAGLLGHHRGKRAATAPTAGLTGLGVGLLPGLALTLLGGLGAAATGEVYAAEALDLLSLLAAFCAVH